jgi:hypothetical protein
VGTSQKASLVPLDQATVASVGSNKSASLGLTELNGTAPAPKRLVVAVQRVRFRILAIRQSWQIAHTFRRGANRLAVFAANGDW